MDKITKHRLNAACDEFIKAIDPLKACELASTFHPKQLTCRIFDEWKKGSYNVCIPVVFEDGTEGMGEKWMVRIPLLPRLAFPEEKMRNPDLQNHLFAQIGEIYIQLYRQQFDRVGALTLNENGDWVFAENRPLTIDISEQELCGLDICRHLPYNRTFQSTIDCIYMIVNLIFNDFYRGRDCITSEEDAQYYLYSIFASQGILMEWVDPKYNHGSFVLIHGDLRPPNIVVDDSFNLVSVLDWEWSQTVPIQMFAPPSWLSDATLSQISHGFLAIQYDILAFNFIRATERQEKAFHNPNNCYMHDLPLTGLWRPMAQPKQFLVAHALLAPHYFSNVYWRSLHSKYHERDRNHHVKEFFELPVRASACEAVAKKWDEFKRFEKERQELGIETEPIIETETAEDLTRQVEAFRKFQKGEKAEPNPSASYLSSLCSFFLGKTQSVVVFSWAGLGLSAKTAAQILVGLGMISAVHILRQKLNKQ
ncbi:hypothetical protein LOZ07_003084 [Ophidiomyces ophidiicola]|uniref:uncharacterized protein n=1 Tax=Ophidiomyces ophidiicola TaxID=1387563 RepID=UPI0020C24C38|nr:uncharacterized protein LOZ57_004426 [Ophidiomyces ophidiicola]KAI1945128.1 hypothetical protein LOZ57_004426 [Ophidiomyces ophidiicola]KAI1957138.1 hypothetical protein LOZ59_003997 [Ophidiomyces ophidiicola]KAI2025409.1 hypothetical protein LOZ45_003320 [Ophidiomyces ophidiicola]KAI2054870.1 hypothetical protein LOZ43_003868 [Ophidiomyces ophidiicola]KAI2128059.1 hypothetical protein LOZ31_002254 [Ophidiomyces ophidiicola]